MMLSSVCAAIRCIRGMSRPSPQTVGSTIVRMPLAYTALSWSMARATIASSSHQSLP
jgi:hypothetical protein